MKSDFDRKNRPSRLELKQLVRVRVARKRSKCGFETFAHVLRVVESRGFSPISRRIYTGRVRELSVSNGDQSYLLRDDTRGVTTRGQRCCRVVRHTRVCPIVSRDVRDVLTVARICVLFRAGAAAASLFRHNHVFRPGVFRRKRTQYYFSLDRLVMTMRPGTRPAIRRRRPSGGFSVTVPFGVFGLCCTYPGDAFTTA